LLKPWRVIGGEKMQKESVLISILLVICFLMYIGCAGKKHEEPIEEKVDKAIEELDEVIQPEEVPEGSQQPIDNDSSGK